MIEELKKENERLQQWVNDLHSGMYINCVYCGHRYGPEKDTPVAMADVLKAHIEKCPKHPLSQMKSRAEAAEAKLSEAERERDEKERECKKLIKDVEHHAYQTSLTGQLLIEEREKTKAALKKAEGEVASLKEELQAVNDIQDCPGGDCLTYTELALEVSRVVIRAESAETKLEAVRELLPRIEAWIKKPVCGCAPMHNDGDCLEHQILPLLKKILPEKEYECEHCHKKSPASLWIADECPICKTYNMPF